MTSRRKPAKPEVAGPQYLAQRCRSLAAEIQGAMEQGLVSLTPEAFAAARALEQLARSADTGGCMTARGIHPTDDSLRDRAERHRARKISEGQWICEVHDALGLLIIYLAPDEQRELAHELQAPGSELQRLLWTAADNSVGQRMPAWEIAWRLYQTMISRRDMAQSPQPITPAAAPDWSQW